MIRVYHNVPATCARCSASCSATVYEIGGLSYGSRCAEIVLGAEVFASVSGKGGAATAKSKGEGAEVMPPRPVRPRTIRAKFGGKCSCGARFAAGAEIVYRDGVEGCASCNFGAAPAVDYLGVYAEMTAAYAAIDAHLKGERRVSPREFGALQARHNAAMSRWCRLTPEQAAESKAAAA